MSNAWSSLGTSSTASPAHLRTVIESFPAPPTHLPPSPLTHNPPLSLPPSSPLPPVPGPSSVSDLESLHILSSLHSKRRSAASIDRRDSVLSTASSTASSTRSRRRDRLDPLDPPTTPFSLPTVQDEPDSLESSHDNHDHSPDDSISSISMGDLPPADDDDGDDHATTAAAFHAQVRTARSTSASHRLLLRARNSIASDVAIERPASPDIKSIIQATPRPRRRSSTRSLPQVKSFRSVSDSTQRLTKEWDEDSFIGHYGPTEPEFLDNDPAILSLEKELDGSDSDSSLDLHTPLSHLMIRHGVLSPRSKVLPQTTASGRDSTLSFASNGSKMNHSGIMRDERDTPQRRMRHKDGRLLKGGIGLTTGLGWSDSEDEDAPSPFTKRISKSLSLSRKSSQSSLRPRDSVYSDGIPAARPRLSSTSSNPPTAWNRRSKSSLRSSTGSSSSLSLNIPDVPPLPTGMRSDFPSTPSSASSTTPITPNSDQVLTTTPSTLKRDKTLPPLPPGSVKKYPSTISLRPPGSGVGGIPSPSLSTSSSSSAPRPLRLAQSQLRSAGDRPAIPVPSPALKSRATSQSLSSSTGVPRPLRLSQSQGLSLVAPSVPPKPRTGTGMVYKTSSSNLKATSQRPTLATRPF